MSRVIISEGKTTNEAIEKGLKELNATRNQVEIKVIEQEKRSFFDILAPRIVKVELTLKEEQVNHKHTEINSITEKDLEIIKQRANQFIKAFLGKVDENYKYEINIDEKYNVHVNINNENSGTLIGYRGETLNSLQNILTSIVNKDLENKARVFLDVNNYKEKRQKTLEDLAIKVSKTVLKENKSITLEPMSAYERKVIHSKLQDMPNIKTHSIGEEPNRRIVIEKI